MSRHLRMAHMAAAMLALAPGVGVTVSDEAFGEMAKAKRRQADGDIDPLLARWTEYGSGNGRPSYADKLRARITAKNLAAKREP